MEADFELKGFDDFKKAILSIGQEAEKKMSPKVCRAGASYLKEKIKAAVPRSEGKKLRAWKRDEGKGKKQAKKGDVEDVHLQDRIGITKRRQGGGYSGAQYDVGVVGLARAYAHVLEYGSSVRGIQGKKYFTRTFEQEANNIMDEFAKKMRKELEKIGRSGKRN